MAIEIESTPLRAGNGQLGCIIKGIDVNRLTDEHFKVIESLLYRWNVVVLKDNGDLTPENQLALNKRFEQGATAYGHEAHRRKDSLLAKDGVTIPSVPQVQVLGSGPLDVESKAYYKGLEGALLHHPTHDIWHKDVLSDEQLAHGNTRFYRWHIDAALYGAHPPLVTTLLGIKNPKGPDQRVIYGDGDELDVAAGATAFVSGAAALEALPEDLRQIALHSYVTYAPHPYTFISPAKCHSSGLVCVSEGLERPLDDLPSWSEDKLLRAPLVWTNPQTGEKSLQLHGACVWKLHLKSSSNGEERLVDDLTEVRDIVYKLMRPGISPKLVYAHRWEDGDLAIFNNRGVWHSVLGQNFGPRLMHQCNLASNIPVS